MRRLSINWRGRFLSKLIGIVSESYAKEAESDAVDIHIGQVARKNGRDRSVLKSPVECDFAGYQNDCEYLPLSEIEITDSVEEEIQKRRNPAILCRNRPSEVL
jgi:hypothetical protein